jgi:triosephosphate isomerase
MRQPLVAGNWKMNGSLDSITALVESVTRKQVPIPAKLPPAC